jgi:DNA-binding transcriptional MocR family regulator
VSWDPARYRAAVMRTPGVDNATRVLLRAMLDRADARGYVRVSRRQLAADLGRTEATVTERVRAARAAGWLQVVERGRPRNVPATWALVIGSDKRAVKAPSDGARPWMKGQDGGCLYGGRQAARASGGSGLVIGGW